MEKEKRSDAQCAKIVNAAIELDSLWGCVRAWRYLQQHQVTPATAARVLSRQGPRRRTDALHPAVRDALARQPSAGMQQRSQGTGAGPQTEMRRSNVSASCTVDQAIALCSTSGRHYAESLLRIHGQDTTTVMRVLFQPHRRRRKAG